LRPQGSRHLFSPKAPDVADAPDPAGTDPVYRVMRPLARTALAGVLVMLWFLDVAMSIDTKGALLPLGGLLPGALVLYGPLRLPGVRPFLAAAWSLVLSLVLLVRGTDSDSPGMMELLALTVLLTSAARGPHAFGISFGSCALLTAAMLTLAMRVPGSGDGAVFAVFMVAFTAAAAISLGAYLRLLDRRRLRAVQRIRYDERLELARDLHDFVAHHVTGIVVLAQAGRTVWELSPQKVASIFDDIEQAGSQTLDSMRQLVTVLREQTLPVAVPAPLHGITQIPALAESFRRGGFPVHLELDDSASLMELPPEISTTAHRVVTEGLTNVRRHAPHTTGVTVRVAHGPDGLETTVRNEPAPPGAGRRGLRLLPRGRGDGYGLLGLHERVRAVGGTFRSGPVDGGGWEVSSVLPVRHPNPTASKGSA
jgi:signal transduction histidine kinase